MRLKNSPTAHKPTMNIVNKVFLNFEYPDFGIWNVKSNVFLYNMAPTDKPVSDATEVHVPDGGVTQVDGVVQEDNESPMPMVTDVHIEKEGDRFLVRVTHVDVVRSPAGVSLPSAPVVHEEEFDFSAPAP